MPFFGKIADFVKKFNADGKLYMIIYGLFCLAVIGATLIACAMGECHGTLKLMLFVLALFALATRDMIRHFVSHQSRFATIFCNFIAFMLCEIVTWIAITTVAIFEKMDPEKKISENAVHILKSYTAFILLWPVTHTLIHLMFIYYSIRRTEKKIVMCSAVIQMGYSIIGPIVWYATWCYLLLDKSIFRSQMSSDEFKAYEFGSILVLLISTLALTVLCDLTGRSDFKNWMKTEGNEKFLELWNYFCKPIVVAAFWAVPMVIVIFVIGGVHMYHDLTTDDDITKCSTLSSEEKYATLLSLLCVYFAGGFSYIRSLLIVTRTLKSTTTPIQPRTSQVECI